MLQRFAFIFVLLLFVPDAYIYWGYIKGKLKGKSRESRQSSIFNVQCSMSRLLWWLPSILLVIGFIAARYIGTDNPMSERQGIIAWLGMLILWLGVPKLIFMLVSLIGKLIHLIIKPVSEKELHLLVTANVSAVFEAVIHDFSEAEAMHYADTLDVFFSAGWKRLFGI